MIKDILLKIQKEFRVDAIGEAVIRVTCGNKEKFINVKGKRDFHFT